MSSVTLEWPRDGYARIVLSRPEKLNAMGRTELYAMEAATRAIAERGCRVISIVAAGPAFGVGGDIDYFAQHLDRAPDMLRELGMAVNATTARLRGIDAAVVVGAQGTVAGGLVGLLASADFIIAADDLKLNLAYACIGGSPDGGTSWFLPRLIGRLRTFELMALSETVDSARALELGLVNRVVPVAELRASVEAVVERLLAVPPVTLANIKRLVGASLETALETQLHREIEGFAAAAATEAFQRGIRAFIAKAGG